jgi:hypothetical protein
VGGEPGGTSGSIHGLGYLISALRREGLIADELVLQLATFLRSLDLFLELIVLAPRTLTANQVRHGGKQGTDDPEHSRIHSSTCPALLHCRGAFRPKDNYFFNVEIIFGAQALTATKIASFRISASGEICFRFRRIRFRRQPRDFPGNAMDLAPRAPRS